MTVNISVYGFIQHRLFHFDRDIFLSAVLPDCDHLLMKGFVILFLGNVRRFLPPLLSLSSLLFPALTGSAEIENRWPFFLQETNKEGDSIRTEIFPPFLEQSQRQDRQLSAFRPLWLRYDYTSGQSLEQSDYFLYPIFQVHQYREAHLWSLLSLVRGGRIEQKGETLESRLDIFPFYFQRTVPDHPERSYRGLFPVFGNVKDRLFHERISWALFPIYASFEKRNHRHHAVLWPIFRRMEGEGARGFAVWPLFGTYEEDTYRTYRYLFWPLVYWKTEYWGEEEPLRERFGFLPFYTRDSGPDFESRAYLWPFFGYREATGKDPYRETLYFWPFFLQGRGESRFENRWMPFYSHRIQSGVDHRWIAWPLYNRRSTEAGNLNIELTRIAFFLFWDLRQTPVNHDPEAGRPPEARKTHIWPLISRWNSGNGIRQVQVLSPIEPLFPHSDAIRDLYSPLFALYRYESREAEQSRKHRLLFSLITYESNPDKRRFDLGPILRLHSGKESSEQSLLRGLIGRRRTNEGTQWRLLWLRLPSSATSD